MEPARCPDCNAELEHPGAPCPRCDHDPDAAPADDTARDYYEEAAHAAAIDFRAEVTITEADSNWTGMGPRR